MPVRLVAAVLAAATLVLAGAAAAVDPDEMLPNPALEARAQAISRGLRCVVCQNQNIDDSAAPLAADMRRLVRERLVAGDSDDQVRAYFVARYGNFVLLKPPFQPDTWLLWISPAIVLVISAAGFLAYLRRGRRPAPPAPLSAEEQARLQALMAGEPEGKTS